MLTRTPPRRAASMLSRLMVSAASRSHVNWIVNWLVRALAMESCRPRLRAMSAEARLSARAVMGAPTLTNLWTAPECTAERQWLVRGLGDQDRTIGVARHLVILAEPEVGRARQ